jgi:hypothetical protein
MREGSERGDGRKEDEEEVKQKENQRVKRQDRRR